MTTTFFEVFDLVSSTCVVDGASELQASDTLVAVRLDQEITNFRLVNVISAPVNNSLRAGVFFRGEPKMLAYTQLCATPPVGVLGLVAIVS